MNITTLTKYRAQASMMYRLASRKFNLQEAYNKALILPTMRRTEFHPHLGDIIGILQIPRLDITHAIIEGTTSEVLEYGVGHYQTTAWPLDHKQIFLAGHRTIVLQKLKHIQMGDVINMRMPYGAYNYQVTRMKIVDQKDVHVIEPHTPYPQDQLVIMTCYPFSVFASTKKRYLVYAERV